MILATTCIRRRGNSRFGPRAKGGSMQRRGKATRSQEACSPFWVVPPTEARPPRATPLGSPAGSRAGSPPGGRTGCASFHAFRLTH